MKHQLPAARTVLLLLLLVGTAFAGKASGQQVRGQITGRVVNTNDIPVPGVLVTALPLTGEPEVIFAPVASATTDANGAFTLSDLKPRLYRVEVNAKGYVTTGTPVRARLGDAPTIRLTRGGVITGRVTDRENRPIIEARVKVMRITDANGKPLPATFPPLYPNTTTDDRGEYRWWGLAPGRYLVWTEGAASRALTLDPLEGNIPTYYPGTPRDGAKEVTVTEGGEATGIDIRHEGRRGFTISGQVVGAARDAGVRLLLLDAETHVPVLMTVKEQPQGSAFTLPGVGSGIYDLVAETYVPGGGWMYADPIRMVVKNRDVDGLTIAFSPSATVTGTVTLTPPEQSRLEACGGKPTFSTEEVSIQPALKRENPSIPTSFEGPLTVPQENGTFKLAGLRPGEYGLVVTSPAGWYVASLTESATPNPRPLGLVSLKKGAALDGVAVTLEFGAAQLRGTVASLPKSPEAVQKLRVHLIPMDETQVENTARYYETTVLAGGGFEFKNLAPGRYAVVVLKKDVPEGDNPAFPVATDPAKRKMLRETIKTAKTIELAPCRAIEDFKIEGAP
jgi:hypothetical protein